MAPTAFISLVASVLGVVPAILATGRARQLGVRTARYWLVFVGCAAVSLGLGALLVTQLGAVSSGSMVGGQPAAPSYSPYSPPGGYGSSAPEPSAPVGPTTEPSSVPSSPRPSATSATPSAPAEFPPDLKLCTPDIAVNDVTSCEFAQVVADAYLASERQGTVVVVATSPVTNKEYEMTCQSAPITVCTGGVEAAVYIRIP